MMFTFYRNFIYSLEAKSGEIWYWSTSNFFYSQRSLKYDYNDNTALMIIAEFFLRLVNFMRVVICYGFISVTLGLVIRLAFQCSQVVIFWFMNLEDRCIRNNELRMRRNHIYF
jgi:hypothetical protein